MQDLPGAVIQALKGEGNLMDFLMTLFALVAVIFISIKILQGFDEAIGRTIPCPKCGKYILRKERLCPFCNIKITKRRSS